MPSWEGTTADKMAAQIVCCALKQEPLGFGRVRLTHAGDLRWPHRSYP